MKKTYIIAEAGVNHNGSLDMAMEMVDAAVRAGADAIKFQTFNAEMLVSKVAQKAEYQMRATKATESQFDMLKRLELSQSDHQHLYEYSVSQGIEFLSTPFDPDSLHFLMATFDLPLIKIASGEITNAPFLLEAAKLKKPVILSTGMSNLGEIESALGVLAFGYTRPAHCPPSRQAFHGAFFSPEGQCALKEKVTLLHCTTEYPTPASHVNLRCMDTLRSAFGLPVGLSDHTIGLSIPLAAVARGAAIIEKHFTLDKKLPGPDHQASLEPDELSRMIDSIREVEEALGDGLKGPIGDELKNLKVARKSLVASRDIKKGELLNEGNLTVKRPGTGISPFYYWEWVDKRADQDYAADEVIKP